MRRSCVETIAVGTIAVVSYARCPEKDREVNRHMQSHSNEIAHRWPEVEQTPRLVFENIGRVEEQMIRYYLERKQSFAVVVGPRSVHRY